MRLRKLVPGPLQPVARATYNRLGAVTASLRLQPQFLVIGAQRCGTTSVFKTLAEHPQVLRPPVEKGIDYFTLNYFRGEGWYNGHFPLAGPARRRTNGSGPPVAFEACTYYLFHPFAIERIARDIPSVKLVVMLRDPVERAFSAYKHEYARGFEQESSFERALDLEDERLVGEYERMRDDVTYESVPHRHHAYVRRGQYAEQLERVFTLFSADQVHILNSESFFADAASEYQRLITFLGLSKHEPQKFDQYNARPSSPMPESIRQRLVEHYAPHDEKLATLLGRPVSWAR
ncbi:MAG: sulfotransferase [Nocardioidaceae bacterium]